MGLFIEVFELYYVHIYVTILIRSNQTDCEMSDYDDLKNINYIPTTATIVLPFLYEILRQQ